MAQQLLVPQLHFRAPWSLSRAAEAKSRCHTSVYFDHTVKRCSGRPSVGAAAGKGFGKTQEAQAPQKQAAKQKKKRPSKFPVPNPGGAGSKTLADSLRSKSEDVKAVVPQFDAGFEDKLKELKQQGSQKLSEVKQDISSTELNRNIYDNPPPLTETLFGNKDKKPDAEGSTSFFNQAALTVGSLLLVGVFLVVSGGSDLANLAAPRQTQAAPELSAEQKAELQQQAEKFEGQVSSHPDDLEALEGAGVTYAQLGDYRRAEALLAKLTSAKSDDAEAWRLLGETRVKLADYKSAAAAFEHSMAVAPNFDILQKLALAYENDHTPQLAVAAVEAAGRALPGNSQEQADLQGYGGVEISLLLGRVYSRWPGHDSQALDLYDRLIANKPDDFRGYLAKGVLLRGEGRQGDAERMFLQARYIAPKGSRPMVDKIIGSS